MSRILYAWEWGAGAGHLSRFAGLAQRLVDAGHEVTVAARDLTQVRKFFPSRQIGVRQAPAFFGQPQAKFAHPVNMAGLAWNLGYDSAERIAAQLEAWLAILDETAADAVVCDFTLTASLAARIRGINRFRIGSGFECPPLSAPLSTFTSLPAGDPQSDRVELQVLDHINRALRSLQLAEVASIAEVMGDPGRTLLATVPEIDPYAPRSSEAEYLGVWQGASPSAVPPVWTELGSHRAVAYLKSFPQLPMLLKTLAELDVEVVLVADGVSEQILKDAGKSVRVTRDMVDLEAAAADCSFAITNANHATTLRMLSLGCPVLVCPLFIEQRLNASRLEQQPLCVVADLSSPNQLVAGVSQMLTSDTLRRHTERFRVKYRDSFANAEDRAFAMLMNWL